MQFLTPPIRSGDSGAEMTPKGSGLRWRLTVAVLGIAVLLGTALILVLVSIL